MAHSVLEGSTYLSKINKKNTKLSLEIFNFKDEELEFKEREKKSRNKSYKPNNYYVNSNGRFVRHVKSKRFFSERARVCRRTNNMMDCVRRGNPQKIFYNNVVWTHIRYFAAAGGDNSFTVKASHPHDLEESSKALAWRTRAARVPTAAHLVRGLGKLPQREPLL